MAGSENGGRGTTLRVGLLRSPANLDPRTAASGVDMAVLHQVFETPYAQPQGEDPPSPVVFQQGLVSESARSGSAWSASIRPDLRFSDGSAATVEDVAEALRGSPSLAARSEVEVRGERVVLTPKRPRARFDLELTQMFCALVRGRGDQLLGTGPFVLDEAEPERIRLSRNPHHRDPVSVDSVDLLVLPPEPDGRPRRLLEAVRSGEVDVTLDLSRKDLKQLRGVNRWFAPGSSTAILYLNVERALLEDVRVRRAVASAIDRSAVAATAYDTPLAFTASGLLPPIMGRDRDGLRTDPDAARDLLREAGCSADRPLEMLVIWGPRPYLPEPVPMAEAIAGQLAAIGLEVAVRQAPDIASYYQDVERGAFDLVLAGWIPDTLDPAAFFECNLSSTAIPRPGESHVNRANLGRWEDAATDEAIERYRVEPSESGKRAVLDRVRDQVPLIPILHGPVIAAHSFRVRSLPVSPLGVPRFAGVQLA